MRTRIVKLMLVLAAVLTGLSVLLTGALAWESEQQALNDMREDGKKIPVVLIKRAKTEEGAVTETVIPGTVFSLYSEKSGAQIGGHLVTDENGEISVRLAPGSYYFVETAPAEGYTFDLDDHGRPVTRYGFTVPESGKTVTVYAYNRPVSVEIRGEKTWDLRGHKVELPKSVTVYLVSEGKRLQQQAVSPDADGAWRYQFTARKYDEQGNEISYTVEEHPVESFRAVYSGYDVLNVYVEPVVLELPDVVKYVTGEEGEEIPKKRFDFVLEGEDGAPMPEGSEDGKKTETLLEAGTVSFGSIRFTAPGTYVYTVSEQGIKDVCWTFDPVVYSITVRVREEDGRLSAAYSIKKDGRRTEEVVFTNAYRLIDLNEEVKVYGRKVWYHGDNPKEHWPDRIVLYLYGDGELLLRWEVTAETDWSYSFELPKYTDEGEEIRYAVDEEHVEDYSKRIDGYNIFNTYVGTPEEPEEDPPKPDRPAKTGDDFSPVFWIALMGVSFLGMVLMVVLAVSGRKPAGKRVMKKGRRSDQKR